MIATLTTLLLSYGWIAGPIGFIGAGATWFMQNRRLAVILAIVAIVTGLGIVILVQRVTIANHETTIAEQRASVDIANDRLDQSRRAVATCSDLANRNAAAVEAERTRSIAALDEVSQELKRALQRTERVRVIKERVNVRIAECPPGVVPPGVDLTLDELDQLRREDRGGELPGPGTDRGPGGSRPPGPR